MLRAHFIISLSFVNRLIPRFPFLVLCFWRRLGGEGVDGWRHHYTEARRRVGIFLSFCRVSIFKEKKAPSRGERGSGVSGRESLILIDSNSREINSTRDEKDRFGLLAALNGCCWQRGCGEKEGVAPLFVRDCWNGKVCSTKARRVFTLNKMLAHKP